MVPAIPLGLQVGCENGQGMDIHLILSTIGVKIMTITFHYYHLYLFSSRLCWKVNPQFKSVEM